MFIENGLVTEFIFVLISHRPKLLFCFGTKVEYVFVGHSVFSVEKSSPYSITERRVPELIPVLGSQPAGDVSQKPGGRLPLLSSRPAVTPATFKKAATNFAAW